MNVFSLLSLIGLVQAFFISLLLIRRKDRKRSNLYLAILFVIIGLGFTNEIIYPTGWFRVYPHLIRINQPFRFLLGPFLYFYIRSLTDLSFRFRHITLIHFIPFVLELVHLVPFYFSGAEAKQAYGEVFADPGFFLLSREWLVWLDLQLSLWLYSIPCLIRLVPVFRRISKRQKSYFVLLGNWQFMLMANLFVFFILLLILDFFLISGHSLAGMHDLLALYLVISLMLLSYFGLIPRKYVTGNLTSPLPEDLFERNGCQLNPIVSQIQKEKLYLDPKLSLEDLAKRANLSRTELSALINKEGHRNYYDFINAFRVDEFKALLFVPENRNKNILDIALDAGFNSKSTFNKVFKAQTGQTPLQYKKET